MKKRILPLILSVLLLFGLGPAAGQAAESGLSISFSKPSFTGTPACTATIHGASAGTFLPLDETGAETGATGFSADCYSYHVYMDQDSSILFTAPGPTGSGALFTLKVDDVIIKENAATGMQLYTTWKTAQKTNPTMPSAAGTKVEIIVTSKTDATDTVTYTFTVYGVDTTVQEAVISGLSVTPDDYVFQEWDSSTANLHKRVYVPIGTETAVVTFQSEAGVRLYAGSRTDTTELTKNDSGEYVYTVTEFQTYQQTNSNEYVYTPIIAYTENEALGIAKETSYLFAFIARGQRDYINGIMATEYAPADGQFVTGRVLDVKNGEADYLLIPTTKFSKYVSLGGFGGYMDFAFETPITNDAEHPYGVDFIVYGNGFAYANSTAPELGNVMVSEDGMTWYTLAGSLHYDLTTRWSEEATLLDGTKMNAVLLARTGDGVKAPFAAFGYADYHMCSGSGDNAETLYTVTGLAGNPYAASHVNNIGDGFDLSWAVDEAGKPVELTSVNYVRVQSAVDLINPLLGENSVEVGTLAKVVERAVSVGVSKAPTAITINGWNALAEIPTATSNQGYTNYYEIDLADTSLATASVAVTASGSNISINNELYADTANYVALLKSDGSRMIRVIVQDGEKEPLIYVYKVTGGGDPATNADLSAISLTPGDVTVKSALAEADTYSFQVDANVEKIKLTVDALNPNAALTLTGGHLDGSVTLTSGQPTETLQLSAGENTYQVTATSTDGSIDKDYKIVVTRAAAVTETDRGMITVSFTFTGDAIHGYTNDDPPQPKPGHEVQTWIETTTVSVPSGSTVKYLTDLMLYNAGIDFDDTDGTYIAKVWHPTEQKWLGEFDNGQNSGWMYRQNGIIAGEGYATRVLKNKDAIVWFYTDDYKQETGYEGDWEDVNTGTSNQTDGKTAVDLKPEVTVDAKGQARVQIIADAVTAAITAAKAGNAGAIVIEPQGTGNASKISVELPKVSIGELAGVTSVGLTLKTGLAQCSLTNAGLAALAKTSGSAVTLSVERVSGTDGKNTGAVKLTVAVDGNSIDTLPGGLMVAIPAQNPSTGTVLVLMGADGTETILRKSAAADDAVVAVLAGSATVRAVENSRHFADVTDDYWAGDAIAFVTSRDLFQGTGTDAFQAQLPMNRSMLVTVLWRLEDETDSHAGIAFDDVPTNAWYTTALKWANETGIVTGTGAGFTPDGNITRESLAVMLYRYANAIGLETTTASSADGFSDSYSIAPWADEAMEWAVGCGLITGKSGNRLDPSGAATRAEVAMILQRMVTMIVR